MNNNNNYLGEEKIGKLMLKFSIPCIMSLLVAALYNVVDQIFIGWGIGYLGNGATNVVFPITIIALAFALFIGDGCAAYNSLCQGMKNEEGIKYGVGNALSLLLGVSVVYVIILAVFKYPLLNAFGATENNLPYAVDYYNIILLGIPFYILSNGLSAVIRADGSPGFAMMSTLVGAIINIILDPIAIFALGMGMKGAALATITGQIVSTIVEVVYLFHAKTFRLDLKNLLIKPAVCGKFLPLGISSFLTQISIVVIMCVMNNALVHYGAESRFGADIPLTVVGIVMKLFQIVISVAVGISVGCQPIIGYNYGAGLNDRIIEVYKKQMFAEIIVGLIATLAFELFPNRIIGIFGSESALYNEFAVLAFRIYLATMLLTCIQKATSIFLQAMGKPGMSMALSLLRDFIFMVPLVLILPAKFGLIGTLYSAPIADVLSLIAVAIFTRKIFREFKKNPAA